MTDILVTVIEDNTEPILVSVIETEPEIITVTIPEAIGERGPKGDTGDDGDDGQDGTDGTNGIAGLDGEDGKSAYEVAVEEGFVGDEATWLESLVGAAGSDGADGDPGEPGEDGTDAPVDTYLPFAGGEMSGDIIIPDGISILHKDFPLIGLRFGVLNPGDIGIYSGPNHIAIFESTNQIEVACDIFGIATGDSAVFVDTTSAVFNTPVFMVNAGSLYLTSADGMIDHGSARLISVADPTDAQDAATKAYVDALASIVAASFGGVATSLSGKQNLHANLTALAGLSLIADKLPFANGAGTLALADFTSFARQLLDDADAETMRVTLAVLALVSGASAQIMSGGSDTTISDGSGILQLGASGGANMGLDANEITARNNGAAVPLYLNNGGGAVYFPDGTLSEPAISFGADTNTGFYRLDFVGAQYMRAVINGVNRLQWYSGGASIFAGGTETTLADLTGEVQIGASAAPNLGMDGNEIQSRSGGVAAALNLNPHGGDIAIGGGKVTGIGDATAATDAMNKQKSEASFARVYTHSAGAYGLAGGRIFIGTEDPVADGFTMAAGDIWYDPS